jgi:hypothetical protein
MFPLYERTHVAGNHHSWNSDSLGMAGGKAWRVRSEGGTNVGQR